ncbi:polyprenyl synthetase family protein [Campylobacter sp. LR291e]|uniref:polyprenyl synthetase family protein n=1 Tax=unclassified Campylobacter TaxID=2593542 RepID=UPI00123BA29A|nr:MULTISPECIES: polyprenyl synthetase family protein [unclassified Campylobacter]KAA6229376.1 polyprenyl synthetase family protein [Campylobacter sp. LR291e]KAA6231182.1 polyprenyl synthetase family protein [Campylobacter sp. LR264d]
MKTLFTQHLKHNLPFVKSFHPFFNKALSQMLESGGKHFRAQLLLGVVNVKYPEYLKKALDAALALEFIHTYSLIHDDLPAMDNADLRRGIATLHKTYDESSAILVGDGLNTEAFLVLSKMKIKKSIRLKLIKTLSFNAGINGMVLGQALDCYFENKKLDLESLKFLHIHKTAKLIAASLKMGGQICKLSKKENKKLYNIGLKLGLAFQINDDIIDATMSSSQSGKTSLNDSDKNSFVNLLGLEEAKNSLESLKNECFLSLKEVDKNIGLMIKELIKQYL